MTQPKETRGKLQNACTMLSPSVFDEIKQIARESRRSRSQVLAMFVARGMAAFHRDGSLIEPEEALAAGQAGVDYDDIGRESYQSAAIEIHELKIE